MIPVAHTNVEADHDSKSDRIEALLLELQTAQMVPKITHLQFLVIRILGAKHWLGREIRGKLAAEGESRSLPSFYEMMSRMEKDGLVEGSDRIAVKAGSGSERRYRATEAGIKRANEAFDFYASRPANSAALSTP